MSTQVQRRKGTTAQHASFTGASAELTVDTTKNTVVVHDGATAGGIPLAKETGSAISATSLSSSSTLGVTGVSTLTGGAISQGLTVGRGAGAVASNTVVGGNGALGANTTGSGNSIYGAFSGAAITSGLQNSAFGYGTLNAIVTGTNNSAFGYSALEKSTASSNVAVGDFSQFQNLTGTNNASIGSNALRSNATGSYNTAIGDRSLYLNTASYNTAVGYQAGYSNTTGTENAYFGTQAGYSGTNGTGRNVAVGYKSLFTANTAIDNVGIGWNSLTSATTGSQNVAVGSGYYGVNSSAGFSITTGNLNTLIGASAGAAINTGSANVIIGNFNANSGGLDIRTGSNWIILSDGDGNVQFTTSKQSGTQYSWALPGALVKVGTGITFPATQNASGDANTLDDYEEGTWTPVLTDGTNNATSDANTGGTYTKIGRMVQVTLYVSITSLGSVSGGLSISGFPFACRNSQSSRASTVSGYTQNALVTAGQAVGLLMSNNATTATVTLTGGATGSSVMTSTQWTGTGGSWFSFSYPIN